MKLFKKQKNNHGFTLIETMIAVFILVVAMNGLLGLISSSLFAARYSKNDLVANYLIQEAVDYIRNDRDTVAFQPMNTGGGWNKFLDKYGYSINKFCFTLEGCKIEVSAATVDNCDGLIGGNFGTVPCQVFYYDETGHNKYFYNYIGSGIPSNFKRQITMSINRGSIDAGSNIPPPDELDIKVTVEWLNGNLTRSRTSRVSLLNWQR